MLKPKPLSVPVAGLDMSIELRLPASGSVRLLQGDIPRVEWRDSPRLRSSDGCLAAFVSLCTDTETKVVSFIEEWGPLWEPGADTVYEPQEDGQYGAYEDIIKWTHYAKRARAITDLVQCLKNDRTPPDWQDKLRDAFGMQEGVVWVLNGIHYEDGRPVQRSFDEYERVRVFSEGNQIEDEQRNAVALLITNWLRSMQMFPEVLWVAGLPTLRLNLSKNAFRYDYLPFLAVNEREMNLSSMLRNYRPQARRDIGVYAVVGIQLAALMFDYEGYEWCEYCKAPYRPKRTPREGERHFCPKHGGGSERHAAEMKERMRVKRQAEKSRKFTLERSLEIATSAHDGWY